MEGSGCFDSAGGRFSGEGVVISPEIDAEALNQLSKAVLDGAFAVHSELGPGLLESAYKACLAYELSKRGVHALAEVPVPVVYDGKKLADVGYRVDLLVENELIVEVKSVEAVAPVHTAQLLSYLRLSKRRLGLLLNFNVVHLRDGIYRRVNRL
jgi:GxxExxY protein